MMTMVGDAYAAPLVEELQRAHYDLSSLYAIGTGGAATNPKYQRALLESLPQITLINGYGSSETGNMGFGHSQRGNQSRHIHAPGGRAGAVRGLHAVPGARRDEVGWVARDGPDSARLFRRCRCHPQDIPGGAGSAGGDIRRPGQLETDGTLRLFGRDSLVVNTGGEKVFVEEVEEVLRAHPPSPTRWWWVAPSERWGEEIVALVALRTVPTSRPRVRCTRTAPSHLARFKAPKEFIFVDQVHRLGNGKADYRWAKSRAVQQESMT